MDACRRGDLPTAVSEHTDRLVLTTGCRSWYLGKDGQPELFPWTPARHRELLRGPEGRGFAGVAYEQAGAYVSAPWRRAPSSSTPSASAGGAIRKSSRSSVT